MSQPLMDGLYANSELDEESYDYSQLLSIFYISYILFEIPCNVCMAHPDGAPG
jgi:hypothetical protein